MNLEFNVQITPFKIIFAALMLVGGGLAGYHIANLNPDYQAAQAKGNQASSWLRSCKERQVRQKQMLKEFRDDLAAIKQQ